MIAGNMIKENEIWMLKRNKVKINLLQWAKGNAT